MGPWLLVTILANVNVRLPAVSKDGKEIALALEKPGSCGEDGREDTLVVFPVPAGPDADEQTWTVRDSCADAERNERSLAAANRVLSEGGFTPLAESKGVEAEARFADADGALIVTVTRGGVAVGTATSKRPRSRNGILGGTHVVAVGDKAYYVHLSWLFRGVPHRPTLHEWIPVAPRR